MTTDSTVTPLRHPGEIHDPLTDIAREGARRMLAAAIEAEAAAVIAAHAHERLADGRARLVRHGHGPEREIQTGVGAIPVRRVKLRDRADLPPEEKIRFTSAILPLWARRSRSLDALLPILYLRGVSSGDFQEALSALLGVGAPNLSSDALRRLKESWAEDYDAWRKRDLSARHYVYVWADGVYLHARMEENAECMLVMIGATPEGRKELIGFQVGVRESAQSWRELLADLRARGLGVAPNIAVGDGALGFWKALEEIWPTTKIQRCWLHKTMNVLDKLPKAMHPAVKKDLFDIHHAENRAAAEAAFDLFIEKYALKYPKAADCLKKDRAALLAFFDFPAEHWGHLRTTNPIESVFATVKHRTTRAKGCLSQTSAKMLVFKLIQAASKTWRRLNGANQLPKIIEGVIFKDGVEDASARQRRVA